MSGNELFTGGSSYINGGDDSEELIPSLNEADKQSTNSNIGNSWRKNSKGCTKVWIEIIIGVVVFTMLLFLIILPLIYNLIVIDDKEFTYPNWMYGWWGEGDPWFKKERLTITVDEPRKERLTNDEYRVINEVYGKVNNTAPDPAVQRVVGKYRDFVTANTPGKTSDKGRKGVNTADSGSNRFAGTESIHNKEGSLWTKPIESGSFIERMSAGPHNDWSKQGRFSEASLDPNNMYDEDITRGQPLYPWGYSPARTPRGKTDILLESISQGL